MILLLILLLIPSVSFAQSKEATYEIVDYKVEKTQVVTLPDNYANDLQAKIDELDKSIAVHQGLVDKYAEERDALASEYDTVNPKIEEAIATRPEPKVDPKEEIIP
jgi:hypothetical protein